MQLKISPRNSKIDTPNFSLPPIKSCRPNLPCFKKCYAINIAKRYKTAANAWQSNLDLYNNDPDQFFGDLQAWLRLENPARFRAFVSGDFPDEDFWERYQEVCRDTPDTKFLAFTEYYDLDFKYRPDNCQIVLSTWPGLELPENTSLPWAWLEGDTRIPDDAYYFKCPGLCSGCRHRCWDFLDNDVHVMLGLN